MARRRTSPKHPVCGFTFQGQRCTERGTHFCLPRAAKVVGFFSDVLVHTKGRWARTPFVLTDWQRKDMIEPVFGRVEFSEEWEVYRRRYTDARIELARKNGKSEVAAGVALLLTCADDEESAEVYGCAVDVPQARKVFDVALRMVQLSPILSKRLTLKESARRIIDERTGSYYEVVPADAKGNLGHNPHGVILDEELTQPNGKLWEALTSAAGARVQPLFFRATTASDDPSSWSAKEHEEAKKIAATPERAPHRFVYLRNTPRRKDAFKEENWYHANPALGEFLSVEALRRDANEAKNDPTKENAFRQFRLNQHVQQTTRWMPLHLWDACGDPVATSPTYLDDKLAELKAFGGLDLSAKLDLTAWCLVFPDGEDLWARWRFWIPEEQIPVLDKLGLGGQAKVWADQGWLTATEGDVIDYQTVYEDIEADVKRFAVSDVTFDTWSGEPVRQELEGRTRLEFYEHRQGFSYTQSMNELMKIVKQRRLRTGGNPVARWHADSVEAKRKKDNPDVIMPVKPDRQKSAKRIDGMDTLLMAIDGWMRRGRETKKPSRRVVGY